MNQLKYYIVLVICLLYPVLGNAQTMEDIKSISMPDNDMQESRKGKFYMIPEFSFWLGTYALVELSPQLAYHVSDRLSFGLGPHYIYHKSVDYYTTDISKTHMWGVKSFSRFVLIKDAATLLPIYIFDELFAHVEYEKIRVENSFFQTSPSQDYIWMDMFFVGLGINQKAGQFSSYSVMLLWDLNSSFSSIYSNPSYRVGMSLYF